MSEPMSDQSCSICQDPVEQYALEDSLEEFDRVLCDKCLDHSRFMLNCTKCGTDDHVTVTVTPHMTIIGNTFYHCSSCGSEWS